VGTVFELEGILAMRNHDAQKPVNAEVSAEPKSKDHPEWP
jgi:hypothetical protein